MKNVLYVANIPAEMDEIQLRELFEQHGEVTTIEFAVEPKTQGRYALVTMATEKTATLAANTLNGEKIGHYILAISYPEADLKRELMPKHRKTVEAIAAELGETEKKPLRMLEAMARLCGVAFLQSILKDTLETEANGGLMTHREPIQRRTKGGVFFFLARFRVAPPVRHIIYTRKGKYPTGQVIEVDDAALAGEAAE